MTLAAVPATLPVGSSNPTSRGIANRIEPEPIIVFTSDVPGLVAAQPIVGSDHERIVFLLDSEFDALPLKPLDPTYRWHVHYWSRFRTELDAEFLARARAKHPLPNGHSYWQHSEGTMWTINAGNGGDHLWRWDGQTPELLEAAMTRWVA